MGIHIIGDNDDDEDDDVVVVVVVMMWFGYLELGTLFSLLFGACAALRCVCR